MATKRSPRSMPAIGRAQAPRPEAPSTTPRQIEGERQLAGALLVPVEQIAPDPAQPRSAVDPKSLQELAASIAAEGLLQPLVVREAGFLDDGRTRYMIIAGGRRYAAVIQAGLTRVPVIVRASEGASLRVLQLTENLHREALAPLDEARALAEIADLESLDTRALAVRLHRSHTYVADRLKLLKHEDVAAAVRRQELTPSAAATVASEPDPARRQHLIEQARTHGLQKRDVQRQRGAAGAPAVRPRPARDTPLVGGQPTLREVGRQLGATDAQIAVAAATRQVEPDLAPAEAIALSMAAEGAFPGELASVPTSSQPVSTLPLPATSPLANFVAAAGGPSMVLGLLRWAIGEGLSAQDLVRAIENLPPSDL